MKSRLLLGLHARIFFIDNIEAHFAFAIPAADNFVIFVAAFQRLERCGLFHDSIPYSKKAPLFKEARQTTDFFIYRQQSFASLL